MRWIRLTFFWNCALILLTGVLHAEERIYYTENGDGSVSFSDTPTEGLRKYPKESPYRYDFQSIETAINFYAKEFNLDPHLLRAIIKTESNYDPQAISRKGAQGLMQIMPNTAKVLNLSDPFNPSENIRAGARYLKDLMHDFNGNLELTLAAYNAGHTKVRQHGGIPPYSETINYIQQVLLYYRQLKTIS